MHTLHKYSFLSASENYIYAIKCFVHRPPLLPFFFMLQGGFYEAFEQRVRAVRSGFQFRMSLRADKERMLFQFHHLYDTSIRGKTGEGQTVVCQSFPVIIVYFIAVSVPFLNVIRSIELISL